jgi:hypothetical protein
VTRPSDNRDDIVAVAVAGRVSDARISPELLWMDDSGRSCVLPGNGGVVLGLHVGDRIHDLEADHAMVGASIEDLSGDPGEPGALHLLSCLGNRVRDASGVALGVVAGKRGGLAPRAFPPSLVAVEATDKRLAALVPGERIVVEAEGRGLGFRDIPEISVANCSPRLLDHLPLQASRGMLEVAVKIIIPSRLAGPGLGQDVWIGDLEIVNRHYPALDLSELRYGDLVAFQAIDSANNRFYRPGFVSIGVISHGPSKWPGHGPGATIVLSGPAERMAPRPAAEFSVADSLRQWGAEG